VFCHKTVVNTKRFVEKTLPIALGKYYNALHLVAPRKAAVKAFDLFCTPRGGRIKEKDKPFLERAQQGNVYTSSGQRIRTYTWAGNPDKVVLLLHGWQSNAGRWRRLGPVLEAEGYTVLAIDAPAHGQSEGRLFNAYLYAEAVHAVLQTQPVHYMVGHSVGGMTLSYFVTHFEAPTVQKLVLLGAPSDLEDIAAHFNKALRLSDRTQQSVRRYFEKRFGNPVAYFSVAGFCARIAHPTLVIHDKQDPLANITDAYRYGKALPNAQLFVTENLGHELQDESVYAEIVRFLE